MAHAPKQAWHRKPQTAVLAAVAAGLYPIFFYFSSNWALVNSWEHLAYFLGMFIGVPLLVFSTVHWATHQWLSPKWARYVLPFLNIFVFLFLLKICLHAGIHKKLTLGILVLAALIAYFLHSHFKKIVGIQLLLASIGLFTLLPEIFKHRNFDTAWLEQPDAIEQTNFQHTPNIYYIQPDGYVNPSELRRGYYDLEDFEMTSYFDATGFQNYPNFRSNYPSTLTSNTSLFSMKHHYYNGSETFNEGVHLRDIIVSENAVLKTLKHNGYETHLLLERPYLLLNRPDLGYDHCNFNYNDIAYIGTGLGKRRDLSLPLVQMMAEKEDARPQFYFIELFDPGHIATSESASQGVVKEKEKWLQQLQVANGKLKKLTTLILEKDPQALIIISGDHGGFVGMDYTQEIYTKTQDRDRIYSMFSTILAIHWPDSIQPQWNQKFRSSVNLFRILFAELSESQELIHNLQPDRSYVILKEGAPQGIYTYIDEDGAIISEPMTPQ